MSESTICLKTVRDLLTDKDGKPADYWIPDYQRGYRWTPLMVTQLLDDLWEFIQSKEAGQFYCLQPIVIKTRPDGRYEVVDGQQRLTTIYIILTFLKDILKTFGADRFLLTFQTRGAANGPFLANIDEGRANENVDFFHICQAYKAVSQWFSGERVRRQYKLLEHLVNTDELGKNVKVIWYELANEENPVDAFTRLNMGKIALTDDELIRALFLRRDKVNDRETEARQRKIAHEWDQTEKDLQNDDFWYFLTDGAQKAQNRIGFLFGLVASSEGIRPEFKLAPNPVFLTFNERLSPNIQTDQKVDPDVEWRKIKDQFMRLKEWYDNRLLFHMVGFMVHQGVGLNDISLLAKGCTKRAFHSRLRQEIFKATIGSALPDPMTRQSVVERVTAKLEDLDYETNPRSIRQILLLFNIATLHENTNSNLRFQFDSLKKQTWNIEHIRSVASDPPDSHPTRLQWFELCAQYLRSRQGEPKSEERILLSKIESFIKLDKAEAEPCFEPLYKEVLQYFHEDVSDGTDNGIANLALLDEGTNKSYGNAPFAVKRDRLLTRDQAGLFIPLCTRNVFLKCYNRQADHLMFWTAEDRAAYLDAMIQTITNFLTGNEGHE